MIGILSKVQVTQEEDVQAIDEQRQAPREMHFDHAAAPVLDVYDQQEEMADQEKQAEQPFIREGAKVGRNDPCPCGSGKKFKQCHGKIS